MKIEMCGIFINLLQVMICGKGSINLAITRRYVQNIKIAA